ncbi:MAG: alanine racemase [Deltaproteobacteria bacterium]|nr:alanine racemase [Deltaproteobacteria bacterium]
MGHSFSHNRVEIDLAAIERNLNQVRSCGPTALRVMAVVKADAYGHGMLPVSRKLAQLGCEYLAVFRLEEAVRLREGGIDLPVVVLMGFLEDEREYGVECGVIPVLHDVREIPELDAIARRKDRVVHVHLKIDTGMGRMGLPEHQAELALDLLRSCGGLKLDGLLTHLSAAEDPREEAYTLEQVKKFRQFLDLAHKMGHRPANNQVSNSAACIYRWNTGSDLVRTGLALYGTTPSPELGRRIALKPVMSFHSNVVQVKQAPAGTSISYGRTFITDRPTTLAAVPVGYADGYVRRFSNRSEVLIRGQRAPVRGRVCMNVTVVDVTSIQGVREGDPVVLLGRQGDEIITAEELANHADTISYEIFTAIGGQNPRIYIDSAPSIK